MSLFVRARQFVTGSVFRRMYLLYTIIILASISFLSVYLAEDMSRLIVQQAIDYNAQQLASLDGVFRSQTRLLAHTRQRLYSVYVRGQETLFDSVAFILRDDRPFSSVQEYESFIYHAGMVHSFFRLVQGSLESEMALFQILGNGENGANVNILWPIATLGGIPYAEEIRQHIDALQEPSGIFPFTSDEGTPRERRLYVLYDTLTTPNDDVAVGLLINGYDTSSLDDVFAQFAYPREGDAFIVREDGVILYATDPAMHGRTAPFLGAALRGDAREEDKYLYNVIEDPNGQYYVIGRMERDSLTAQARAGSLLVLRVAAVCAAGAVLLTLLSTRQLKRRVRALRQTMHAAQEGDLSVRADVRAGGDEIDQIAASLNRMVERLDAHIQAEYVNELQKSSAVLRQREAELVALSHQVNPHFLYNTLEVIRMRALDNGDEDTALLIRWLAELFRRRTRTDMVVTMRDELSYCVSLTEILRAKFSGEIDVEIDLPEAMLDFGILKDTLQPPLENAFVHGFSGSESEEERLVRVDGMLSGGDMILRVFNNGLPISPDVLDGIHARLAQSVAPGGSEAAGHIGLVNVHQRLRMAYGEGYGVTIDSGAGGTTVTLTFRALTPDALRERITPKALPTEQE